MSELEAERRAGRPKSRELLELEELRRREVAEWETGFGKSPNLRSRSRQAYGEQKYLT